MVSHICCIALVLTIVNIVRIRWIDNQISMAENPKTIHIDADTHHKLWLLAWYHRVPLKVVVDQVLSEAVGKNQSLITKAESEYHNSVMPGKVKGGAE